MWRVPRSMIKVPNFPFSITLDRLEALSPAESFVDSSHKHTSPKPPLQLLPPIKKKKNKKEKKEGGEKEEKGKDSVQFSLIYNLFKGGID